MRIIKVFLRARIYNDEKETNGEKNDNDNDENNCNIYFGGICAQVKITAESSNIDELTTTTTTTENENKARRNSRSFRKTTYSINLI